MKIGDRVKWTYEHHLNRNSSTMITKKGVIKRFVGYDGNPTMNDIAPFTNDIVCVQFEGNKNPSRVPYGELKTIELIKEYIKK